VKDDLVVLSFATSEAFVAWLDVEHASSPGLWLRLGKKATAIASVTYSEALDGALCFGWIDGQKASDDGDWWLQRFTPRRARSRWSQVNCARAEALILAGRMRPAGLAAVEAAKADGRWAQAYASPRTAEVPADLRAALDDDPEAAAAFAGLDGRNRYSVLYRIAEAKRPQTRRTRIETFVVMLREGRRLYP
jgi:uncharacterized protein YdeI (YjbR/CyaY-like superfamily)